MKITYTLGSDQAIRSEARIDEQYPATCSEVSVRLYLFELRMTRAEAQALSRQLASAVDEIDVAAARKSNKERQ